MKLQKNNRTGQHFLNLPRSVIELIGWQKKDKIEFEIINKNNLIIKKLVKEDGKK